jgi:endoglycosylceramidase
MDLPSPRRLAAALACALLCGAPLVLPPPVDARTPGPEALGPVPPLSPAGRWLTDELGRVVILHGFNFVAKSPPFYPAAFGFGDDDAAFLAAEGFNGFRLGVDVGALMPAPGVIRDDYIERLAESVDVLARHRIVVLIDFHQDGFSPMFNGNGLPDWMAITDGLPNPPDAVFPLYYVQNPAMQRAFEHFWANDPGPDGVPLQEHYVRGLVRVAERFKDDPWVVGYDLMNEPWPGADWQPCVVGCPEHEERLMAPFHARATAAVRAVAPRQLVFVEPFVLFNFGQAATSLPGTDPGNGLSFHSYALDAAGEEGVVARAVEAAERDGSPVIATEFGATLDAAVLDRIADRLDARHVPWLEWAYNESIIADRTRPAGPDNLRSVAAFTALVRPYATAVAGIPSANAFDPATGTFEYAFTPATAATRDRAAKTTVLEIPDRHYPDGYRARVRGAWVDSPPCARRLVLRTKPRAKSVSVLVTPRPPGGGRACRRGVAG